MGIYYSKNSKKVSIDWDEKKKDGVEHWHAEFTPINVFYHPKQKNQLLRVTLKGKMPKWVERFASKIKFKFGVTSDDNGKQGFWLANWNAWDYGDKPISAPNLEGSIHQFLKKIPDELKSVKERAKNNKMTIKENLLKNASFFEDIGIYYRPEELKGNNGTLLIDNDIFPDKDELTDEEYAKILETDGKLERAIWELTTPIPDTSEDESTEVELQENLEIGEELQPLDEFEDLNLDENFEELDETLLSEEAIEITLEEDVDLIQPNEEPDIFGPGDFSEEQLLEIEPSVDELNEIPDEQEPSQLEEGFQTVESNEAEIELEEPKEDPVTHQEEQEKKGKLEEPTKPSLFFMSKEKETETSKPKKKSKKRKKSPEQETIPLF